MGEGFSQYALGNVESHLHLTDRALLRQRLSGGSEECVRGCLGGGGGEGVGVSGKPSHMPTACRAQRNLQHLSGKPLVHFTAKQYPTYYSLLLREAPTQEDTVEFLFMDAQSYSSCMNREDSYIAFCASLASPSTSTVLT